MKFSKLVSTFVMALGFVATMDLASDDVCPKQSAPEQTLMDLYHPSCTREACPVDYSFDVCLEERMNRYELVHDTYSEERHGDDLGNLIILEQLQPGWPHKKG